VRARRLFLLPSPGRPLTASARQTASAAARVLAAVGPLSVAELQAAVARTHTHRTSSAPAEQTLIESMVLSGARHDGHSDRWSAPAGSVAWPRDRALLTAADPDTVYTRQQLTDLMIAAGYSALSAGKNTLDMHPLIQKLDRNRYRILTGRGPDRERRHPTTPPITAPS
jgi:hypothetical protein